jgi:hypothetical protein
MTKRPFITGITGMVGDNFTSIIIEFCSIYAW